MSTSSAHTDLPPPPPPTLHPRDQEIMISRSLNTHYRKLFFGDIWLFSNKVRVCTSAIVGHAAVWSALPRCPFSARLINPFPQHHCQQILWKTNGSLSLSLWFTWILPGLSLGRHKGHSERFSSADKFWDNAYTDPRTLPSKLILIRPSYKAHLIF
jgi:hypothetical protein